MVPMLNLRKLVYQKYYHYPLSYANLPVKNGRQLKILLR